MVAARQKGLGTVERVNGARRGGALINNDVGDNVSAVLLPRRAGPTAMKSSWFL